MKIACLGNITSLINLHTHVMDVILVQAPVKILQAITKELLACKGVKVVKLTLTSTLFPPLHPLTKS